MKTRLDQTKVFAKQLEDLRKKIDIREKSDVKIPLKWLAKKRRGEKSRTEIVPIHHLSDWFYSEKEGIVRHRKGANRFFSLQGVLVKHAAGTEVEDWNQPILVQKKGGFLVILCQERNDTIKFLLQAKFEAGNINKIQFGPTIQATYSNLSQHHEGRKPLLSEYIDGPSTKLIYSSKHNEDGSRFWQKSNVNRLIMVKPNQKIPTNDNFIWLTLSQIKKLMLHNNVVNPFVKTILAPL